jgi:AraC-like DNA-binding protein
MIVMDICSFSWHPFNMELEQVRCPDCNESYTRLLSRWRFCPFCGNRGVGNVRTPYTVDEVSALTGFNRTTVTRMFEKEQGVLILPRPETMHKRRYRSLRIPRAVYERVIRRLAVR